MSAKQELILHICPEEHSIRVENVCDGVTAFKEIALETFYDCVKHSIRHEGIRSGFLPQNCFHVSVNENGDRHFCLWHPHLHADISYFGTEYPNFPLPRLVFGFRVSREGMQEQLVDLSARYDEMAKDGAGDMDTAEIDRRLQELHQKLGQRGAEQYAPKYARHIAVAAAKIKELGAKYSREAALLKGFQPGVVCPTCRRAVSEADLGAVQAGIRQSLEAIMAEGRAQKGQLDELQALEKQSEEAFLRFQKDDVAQIGMEIEELNRQREGIDAARASSHDRRKDELESLHNQIQAVTADIEYGNLSQEEYDRLMECRELLRECRAELDAAKKAAQMEPEDYDAKIAQVESLILDKKKLLADAILYVGKRAELTFSQLKMNLVEIALSEVVKSTGEVKDVFKFTYGGRYYNRLSLSEKIRAGLEVSELVKRLTGRNYPVFIDNMESVDELTNVRPTGQIIMAKCVRGAALTVKPMGRPQVQKAA